MKRSNRLVIFVGVLLAILAFVGIVIVLNNNSTTTTPEATTVAVLVAKEDIAIGDPVTPDKVEVKNVEPGAVSGTAFGDPSQVNGQPALVNLATGSQVNQESVAGGVAPIAAQLKPGEKAISFQVDRVTGLDFLIQAGDHIDIVLSQSITVLQPTQDTASKPADQQRFETIPGLTGSRTVKTILQDKRVLYVSQTRVKTTAPAASASPGATADQPAPTQIENVIIVFAGTDQDAEAVKFAQNDVNELGSLTAVLRNTTDADSETTTGVTIDKLVTEYGLPLPNIIQRQKATP